MRRYFDYTGTVRELSTASKLVSDVHVANVENLTVQDELVRARSEIGYLETTLSHVRSVAATLQARLDQLRGVVASAPLEKPARAAKRAKKAKR